MLENPFDPSSGGDDDEKRREHRLLALFPTFYSVDGGRRRSALCIDLSVSGMRLATHTELEMGREIRTQVFVGDGGADVWEFSGTVARVESREDARYWSHQVGVKFERPMLEMESKISSLALEFPGHAVVNHE